MILDPLSRSAPRPAPARPLPSAPAAAPQDPRDSATLGAAPTVAPKAPVPASAPVVQTPAPPVVPPPVTLSAAEAPAQALGSRPTGVLFDGFLKVRTYELEVQRPSGVEKVQLMDLNGPGHNCAMVGTVALAPDGTPQVILKQGDTRLSRQLRGEDYVKLGPTGGRLDKVGAGPEKIGLGETAEELGGTPVEGSFRRLGGVLSPTMPGESTEADAYFSAVVQLGQAIEGDGGGMEAVGLIGPRLSDYAEFTQQLKNGDVAEAGRTRTVYGRTLDSLGYVPQLGAYVHDCPALRERFSTLGLGEPWDPRGLPSAPLGPAAPGGPPTEAARIDHAEILERRDVPLGLGTSMVDATTAHAVPGGGTVGKPFPNQVMTHHYDRAKVVLYYEDPQQGPMVYFPDCERPLMALKATAFGQECDPSLDNTDLVRHDLPDLKVERHDPAASQTQAMLASSLKLDVQPRELCHPTSASSGQSDLQYHLLAGRLEAKPDLPLIPLAQALQECRTGQGDAQSEAALLMLSDDLGWIPQLGMSVDTARKLL